jgi:hypothetical protein
MGVFPVPPALMLPMQITGTSMRTDGKIPLSYRAPRNVESAPNKSAGTRSSSTRPPRCASTSSVRRTRGATCEARNLDITPRPACSSELTIGGILRHLGHLEVPQISHALQSPLVEKNRLGFEIQRTLFSTPGQCRFEQIQQTPDPFGGGLGEI